MFVNFPNQKSSQETSCGVRVLTVAIVWLPVAGFQNSVARGDDLVTNFLIPHFLLSYLGRI